MKTKHQLLQEWNESTYGLEFGDYVYQYFVSEFNKPPVYGQWIDVKERLPDSKKDVLCLMDHVNRKDIQFVGCYTKGHEIEYWDDDYQGEYDEVEDKNGTLYLKPGWYECEETPGGEYDEVWVSRNVTHWCPLPPSPGSVDVEEKKECEKCKEFPAEINVAGFKGRFETDDDALAFKDRCIFYQKKFESVKEVSREGEPSTQGGEETIAIQDRMIGELTRDRDYYKDSYSRRQDWLRQAKAEAGADDRDSFDNVWKSTLDKAKEFERLKQENERLKEELIRKNNSISKLRISVNQKKKF